MPAQLVVFPLAFFGQGGGGFLSNWVFSIPIPIASQCSEPDVLGEVDIRGSERLVGRQAQATELVSIVPIEPWLRDGLSYAQATNWTVLFFRRQLGGHQPETFLTIKEVWR